METQPRPGALQEASAPTVADALGFLNRRKWLWIGIALPILLAAILLAFKLPAVYRSEAMILVEQPAIPEDIVASSITSYVDEQIQVVSQRVLTRENVLELIEQFDLYSEEPASTGPIELADRFRNNAYLQRISAETTDFRGRTAETTFAFTVGFHYSDPVVAQQVTAELADLYLNENVRSRQEKASETTAFLEAEAERLSEEMAEVERRMAEYKDEYGDALPEQLPLNMQALDRTERDLATVESDLRQMRAEREMLRSELATMDPYAAILSESGEPVMSAAQRLAELRQEYLQLSSRYGPEHPDVKRAKREIEAIVGSGSVPRNREMLEQQREMLLAERNQLLDRYSPEHPDVRRIDRTLESLEEEIRTAPSGGGTTLARGRPNNPAYIQKQLEIESLGESIASAQQRRSELVERRARMERNVAIAPRVEKEWLALNRGYDAAREEFTEIKRRSTEARLSERLETENMGQRFTLLERAKLPESPVEPSRPGIIFLGFVVAFGLGIGVAALVDALDTTVRSARDLRATLGLKPLATVPYIETGHDRRMRWVRRLGASGAVAASLAVVFMIV